MDYMNSVAGFGVGLMVGMTGVGGGALMTPLLVLLIGVAPATAVGTDLWFAAVTKMAGGGLHGSRGTVDWLVLRRLCTGSLPSALATLAWIHYGGGHRLHSSSILAILGVVLIATALAMLLKTRLHGIGRALRIRVPEAFKRVQPAMTVLAGAILGFLVTFTSIGAGALGAAMLTYLYPFRLTPARLVGTDIVHAIPLTVVAGSGHMLMGNVDLGLLFALLLGSIPGVLLGSLATLRTSDTVVRGAIAVVLAVVGFKLVT